MTYSFFAGCKIPYFLPEYGNSALALLNRFGIEVVDLEFNCCGYPARDLDFKSFLLAGARNLALAERKNTDIVTPCKCCFGSLKFVEHYLRHRGEMKAQINAMLQAEGLQWEGRISVRHLLTVLQQDIGLNALRAATVHSFKGLKVAVHTGCHALRPGNVTRFDNPLVPGIFDDLVTLTGAASVFWPMSTECCGNPQWDKNRSLAMKQMQKKMVNAKQAGAEFVCTACTYCQIQFEQEDRSAFTPHNGEPIIPAILISQLIGLSIGLADEEIGIGDENRKKLMAYADSN